MAAFTIAVTKWDGLGDHSHHIIGVTPTRELAQELMIKKSLHILKLHRKLRDHRFLHFQREYEDEEKIDLGDIRDWMSVLRSFIAYRLSDGNSVCIHQGKRGFAVKIKEVPVYTKEDIHLAPIMWEEKLAQKIGKKREKLARLEHTLAEYEQRRRSGSPGPSQRTIAPLPSLRPVSPRRSVAPAESLRPVSPRRPMTSLPVVSAQPESPVTSQRSFAQTLFPFLQ